MITIGGIVVTQNGNAIQFTSGLAVDADGCPTAYGPPGTKHRDAIGNAHTNPRDLTSPWCGVVTIHGEPVVQGPNDPAPGFYVSPTALADYSKAVTDPRRYVDSAKVPYLSVPPDLMKMFGVSLGDVALCTYKNQSSHAIVADVGPHGKLSEGSIALCMALGLDGSPRHGGIGGGVEITIWPGTSKGWPRILDDIVAQVASLSTMKTTAVA